MSRARKPCRECGEKPKKAGSTLWCDECWLRHQPMVVQVEAAEKRREMNVALHGERRTVPQKEWPQGRRWCSGCQSFRSWRDVARSVPESDGERIYVTWGETRCRPCNSAAVHRQAMSSYGITPKDYAALVKLQGGRCAICGGRPRSMRLARDHDHSTGAMRGLLCSICNHKLLGGARESVAILQAAIDYLTNPPASGRWTPPLKTLGGTTDGDQAPY